VFFLAMNPKELSLRYGCNPHQMSARVYIQDDKLPISVLHGDPGYINLLDALNSWQLVRELRQTLRHPAAASFKHVSPTGVAVGIPLTEQLRRAYFVNETLELSPLASAYARARGSDRVSSFGDWIALSDTVDVATAQLLRPEVSDGVIAPGYDTEALKILKQKRRGNYIIIEIDSNYEPAPLETREIFGICFEQQRNHIVPNTEHLRKIVTRNQELPDSARRDLLVAMIALKYTQSNSVCLVIDGQTIGIGAGQQSRIGCTQIAIEKAQQWYLRQHPNVLDLPFRTDLKRPERDNAVIQYLHSDLILPEEQNSGQAFTEIPNQLNNLEKQQWLANLEKVCLGSDGYIPFCDNIDVAHHIGVQYVVQPGGSLRDEDVISACDEYGISMVFSGLRLFHH
jgi:phosphoribosylaminoimidazolecarboxamide formyltransferase / IMP cyclohydrolase